MTKCAAVTVLPPAFVTAIGPLVAPAGTVAETKFVLSTLNAASTPLNVTDAITGAYIVSWQNGQQLGDFRIERRKKGDPRYYCNGGTVTEVPNQKLTPHTSHKSPSCCPKLRPLKHPEVIVVPPEKRKLKVVYAIVTADYAAIKKRCAFLPTDNDRRCNWEPETIARLRKFNRLTILPPLTRAEDGEDIYKVRTAQGWEGWINSNFVDIQQ